MIRQISLQKMSTKDVLAGDLSSIDLDIDSKLTPNHELLQTPAAAEIMNLAPFFDKSKDIWQNHYIQALIGIQMDPHVQIR